MIRDTSAQDKLIEVKSSPKKKFLWIGGAVVAVVALALFLPSVTRLFSADASVSASRLAFATVQRGPFIRDIAAEGQVVAAVSPTLYATYGGAVTLQVHAGDTVKKGQVLAVIDSPELKNKLAQEESNADAMEVDYQRAQIDARQKQSQMQKAYDNAKIDEETAARDYQRYDKAYKLGGVPQMDVDKANDALEKAKITMAHAQADLNL
ncbi:biotin/lipoyl-binding protein, partial [Dyella sp.]|uniref:biotin/lipoyl-binding protein n=1 Tax=Dyella sp. TaxID=1869338 RepID=UPI002B467C49